MFGGRDVRYSCLIIHVHKAFSFGVDVANILCYICTHTVSCHEFTQQYLLLNSCSTHCSTCLYLGCSTDVCIIYLTVLKGISRYGAAANILSAIFAVSTDL